MNFFSKTFNIIIARFNIFNKLNYLQLLQKRYY